jgi:hypothetical protein
VAVNDDLTRLAAQPVLYLTRWLSFGQGMESHSMIMQTLQGRLRQATDGTWVFQAGVVSFALPQDGRPGVVWLGASATGITGGFQVAGAPGDFAEGALIENILLSTENPSAFQQPPVGPVGPVGPVRPIGPVGPAGPVKDAPAGPGGPH